MRRTIISATSNEQFATETFTNGFQLKNETTKTAAASATTTSDDDEFEVITSRLHARKMEHQQQQNIVKMCLTQKAQNHQCCQLYLFLILPAAISIKIFLRFDFQSQQLDFLSFEKFSNIQQLRITMFIFNFCRPMISCLASKQ